MKKQLATLLLGIISLGAYSQASTIWTPYGSGLNTNGGIRYLSVIDTNTVWAIGFYGTTNAATNRFTRTIDGSTFTVGTFLPDTNTFSASSISAVDANIAFISVFDKAGSGTSGQILQTTNGGGTWNNIAGSGMFTGTNNFPDFVHFWDANNGIAVGDPNGNTTGYSIQKFEIWQTNNGGANWGRVLDTLNPTPQANEYGLSNSYAVYGQKVWFGTSTGRVYSSSDSGKWVVYPTGLYGGANGLAFRDSLNGLVWGFLNSTTQTTTVLNTTNGGHTWNLIPANIYIGKNSFCAIPGTNGFMSVGLNQAASAYATAVTYDNGANWTILESNTSNTEKISVVRMIDTLHGWAGTPTTGSTNGMNKYIGNNLAGIQQIRGNNNRVTVYPNPSNGYFTFSLTNIASYTDIAIHDMLGNEVYKTTLKENIANQSMNINLSDAQKGMYILKIQSGASAQVQKLIIQ